MKSKSSYQFSRVNYSLLFLLVAAILLPAPQLVTAADTLQVSAASTGTICTNFLDVGIGNSVEGLGTLHPDLNISATGNAVALAEAIIPPDAYSAPNGDAGIKNGGVDSLLGGFTDMDRLHEYTFTFAPDLTIDYFSVKMLDFGDFNPVQATEHAVSLVAFDATDTIVATDSLAFTSDGQVIPRGGSAGDLWLTGDAITAASGEPGNFTFTIAGSDIVRVELQFSSNLGQGATDPNFALSVLCFLPEEPKLDPPTAELILIKLKHRRPGGKFEVHYACSETAPNLVSATINGYDVADGQRLWLFLDDDERARYRDGELIAIFGPSFSLDVTCADDAGNEVSTSVAPVFEEE